MASVGKGRRTFSALRRVAATALVAAGLLAAAAGPAAAAGEGEVDFELGAGSWFDSYITSATSAQKTWMNDHYSRMRGFAPFFNQALSWAPPADFYQDIYALYRNDPRDQALMEQHPDWVLRDAQGNRLFIQYACDGTTCSQYAADIGNPNFRAYWINMARDIMAKGYDGIFVDDVNMEMKVSNGAGNFVRPMDPRTGQPMTDANWRRYMAEFTEAIRAAFPDKEITHNSLWWMDRNDPYVQRQVAAADNIEMERGFNDGGIGGGTGQWSFSNYLSYVDWVHSKGAGVSVEPYNLTATSAVFELASYLLVNNGSDRLISEYKATPTNWWSGYDTDLGDATGGRYSWNGLLRRDFSGGLVLVNEPGASSKTVQLPSGATYKDLSGNTVTSVTLGARQAAVLISTPAPASGDTNTDTGTGSGGSTSGDTSGTTGSGDTTSGGTTSGSTGSTTTTDPAPAASSPTTSTTTSSTTTSAPTIKVNRKKVKRGRKIKVSGAASASRVEIRAYVDGDWQLVSTDESVEGGSYSATLQTTEAGTVDLKATAPGAGESGTVTIKVKG